MNTHTCSLYRPAAKSKVSQNQHQVNLLLREKLVQTTSGVTYSTSYNPVQRVYTCCVQFTHETLQEFRALPRIFTQVSQHL